MGALEAGVAWATELRSHEPERRGAGLKRWIAATAAFVQHLKTTSVRTSVARCLRPDIEKKLFGEIDGILPMLEAAQVPKKDEILDGGEGAEGIRRASRTHAEGWASSRWSWMEQWKGEGQQSCATLD